MKIILIKNVENLGKVGETKEVKSGFFRNFLLPQKLAILFDTPEGKKILAENNLKNQKTNQKQKEEQVAGLSLTGQKIIFQVKINKKGKPFETIGAKDIAKKLDLSEKQVKTEPLKELGQYQVMIKSGDKEIKIKVAIVAEK